MSDSPLSAVVKIESTDESFIYRGSGVLLAGGKYVLTAAHLFNHDPAVSDIDISNDHSSFPAVSAVYIHPDWDSTDNGYNHDIAVVELANPITAIDGLDLWSGENPIGQEITFAGYGGDAFHSGSNTLDGYGELFNLIFPRGIVEGSQLLYDHDNGSTEQDALWNLFRVGDAEETLNEGLVVQGDSGGPLLIGDEIVGISSYVFRSDDYDINSVVDASAGEVASATAVEPYTPWIEAVTADNPVYASPTSQAEVLTEIAEPLRGSVINYFLLEMSSPKSVTVSLQYTTRELTAIAGEDYESVSGQIDLQPGETYIAIPVTIYGDMVVEDSESFSMVVTDPTGEWINADVELIATHTILNNDILG